MDRYEKPTLTVLNLDIENAFLQYSDPSLGVDESYYPDDDDK